MKSMWHVYVYEITLHLHLTSAVYCEFNTRGPLSVECAVISRGRMDSIRVTGKVFRHTVDAVCALMMNRLLCFVLYVCTRVCVCSWRWFWSSAVTFPTKWGQLRSLSHGWTAYWRSTSCRWPQPMHSHNSEIHYLNPSSTQEEGKGTLWAIAKRQHFHLCASQSDREKSEGLPVAPFMDRDKVTKPTAQIGFIKFVLIPMFEAVMKVGQCVFTHVFLYNTHWSTMNALTVSSNSFSLRLRRSWFNLWETLGTTMRSWNRLMMPWQRYNHIYSTLFYRPIGLSIGTIKLCSNSHIFMLYYVKLFLKKQTRQTTSPVAIVTSKL